MTTKKATFIFWLILVIFKKVSKADIVAMINPFTLNILSLRPYIIPDSMWIHEFVHICQVRKLGRFRFLFKYLFYLCKYGYEANPFEKEAYAWQHKFINDRVDIVRMRNKIRDAYNV